MSSALQQPRQQQLLPGRLTTSAGPLIPPARPPARPAVPPQKLKAAGFGAGQTLESAWQQHMGKETAQVGSVQFVPRQA